MGVAPLNFGLKRFEFGHWVCLIIRDCCTSVELWSVSVS